MTSLLDLPEEILLQICREIILSSQSFILGKQISSTTPPADGTIQSPCSDQKETRDALAVMCTSKRLNKIMKPLFFREQKFQIHIEAPSSTWNVRHQAYQNEFLEAYGNKIRNVVIMVYLCTGGMCSNPTWLEAIHNPMSIDSAQLKYRCTTEITMVDCRKEFSRIVQLLRNGRKRKISKLAVRWVISDEFKARPHSTIEGTVAWHLLSGLRELRGYVVCVEDFPKDSPAFLESHVKRHLKL